MAEDAHRALALEIKEHVAGVDAVLTKIIKDRSLWKDFFRNPAKVLGQMGFARPPSDETAWQYNKMFYALLTDKALLQFVYDQDFCPRMSPAQVDQFYDNLHAGKVQYDPDVDVDVLHRLKNNPGAFRILLKLSLTRINQEKIFAQTYDDAAIDRCIDAILSHAKEGNSLSQMVKNLPWHDQVGDDFTPMAVVPPAIALPVVVEAVACGTLACVVVPMPEAGKAKQSLETLQAGAFRGNRDSIQALSTLGLLVEFIGELADHVNEFERILRG